MDWLLTIFYFGYLVLQYVLVNRLYVLVKESMQKIAEKHKCYIFGMKMIIFLHIGMRMVMNVMSDSAPSIQGNLAQQISWVYILLGDAITEMLSAFGMILLITVTFNFEAEAMMFIHQENQQKLSHLINEKEEEEEYDEEEEVEMQAKPATGKQAPQQQQPQQQQAMNQQQMQAWMQQNPQQYQAWVQQQMMMQQQMQQQMAAQQQPAK
jgi:hypothetical protein